MIKETENILDWIFGKAEKFSGWASKLSNHSYTSIADRASEGILQFPMIISRSIDVKTAQMIAKALERSYTSFAEVVMTMNPEVVGKDTDISKWLHQFHQNTKENIFNFNESYAFQFNLIQGNPKMFNKYYKELRPYMEEFVKESLNDKYVPSYRKNIKLSIPVYLSEAKDGKGNKRNKRISDDVLVTLSNPGKSFLPTDILKDNDVKKSNELVPSTLHIRVLRRATEETGEATFIDFIIGIKVYMHPVDSNEMIRNLTDACRNKDNLFEFIRWTSGEISFFKDFLFRVNDMKQDVINQQKGDSKWWGTLKSRRRLSSSSSGIFKDSILPNSTIVFSTEEVDYIKANYGFDLMDTSTLSKIINLYFLLGIVIVDSASEIAWFMYENETNLQAVTFNGLERENSNATKQFRDMLKAAQKM